MKNLKELLEIEGMVLGLSIVSAVLGLTVICWTGWLIEVHLATKAGLSQEVFPGSASRAWVKR
jgi:hypothetical protein